MIPEMLSLSLFLSEKIPFAFLTEGEYHICRRGKYYLYRIYRQYQISMYFLEKSIFHFPSNE